jgi:hypothetical protein
MGNSNNKNKYIELPVINHYIDAKNISIDDINTYLESSILLHNLNININSIAEKFVDCYELKNIIKYYIRSQTNKVIYYDKYPLFRISRLNRFELVHNFITYNYFNAGINTLLLHVTLISNENINFLLRINIDLFASVKKCSMSSSYITEKNKDYDKKYLTDLHKYGENIIEIYGTGVLSVNFNRLIDTKYFQYILTKVYKTNFRILMFDEKIKLLLSLLNFLNKVYINNCYIFDLKCQNIGYDRFNGDIIMKLLDYDDTTIRSIDNAYHYFNKYETLDNCIPMLFGSIIPLYISKEFITTIDKEDYFRKSYVGGLMHIILVLFYNSKINIHLIETITKFIACKNDIIIFNNYDNVKHHDIEKIINALMLDESASFDKLLKDILINLINKNIKMVMEPIKIKTTITNFINAKTAFYDSSSREKY